MVIGLVGVGGLVGWVWAPPAYDPRAYERKGLRAEAPGDAACLLYIGLFPFAVFVMLGAFVGMVLILVMVLIWVVPIGWLDERRFRDRLRVQGRLPRMNELQPKLEAGEGTLMVEMSKGSRRVWWTPDDVPATGEPVDVEDDEEYVAILSGEKEHAFNTYCLREYLDEETGKALLTPIRPTTCGQLAKRYPKMRVIGVVVPLSEPEEGQERPGEASGDGPGPVNEDQPE